MGMTREFRLLASVAAVVPGGLILSGCIGGPTYGTDKSGIEQLMDDLGKRCDAEPTQARRTSSTSRAPAWSLPPSARQTLVEPQQSLASQGQSAMGRNPRKKRATA